MAEYLVDTSHFLHQDLYRHVLVYVQQLHHFQNEQGWSLPHAPPPSPSQSFCKVGKITALGETLEQFQEWKKGGGMEGKADVEIGGHLQRWLYAWGYLDLPLEVIGDKQSP